MRRLLDSLDTPTIFAVMSLAGIGLLAIASSTAKQPGRDDLWKMQLIWILIASVAAVVVVLVDYHVWAGIGMLLHGAVVALLVLVLFYGREIGGNKSWLVFGPVRLQPSELAKWTTCLVVAGYLAHRHKETLGLREILELGVLVGVPMGLIVLQPDYGTALIFVPIFLAAIWLGGLRWKVITAVLVIGLALAPVVWTQLEPYQQNRILTVFDQERDPSGVGYQVRQSKIAIGSGGLTGKGLFGGTQSQLNYLPAQHTDFILAVIAEELGFLGGAGVLGLFYFLMFRGFAAARTAQDRLGTYLCLLVVSWITGQVAINVGMVLGLLPTIGVPLPLLSYGGSALVAVICGIGLVVNVRTRRFVN